MHFCSNHHDSLCANFLVLILFSTLALVAIQMVPVILFLSVICLSLSPCQCFMKSVKVGLITRVITLLCTSHSLSQKCFPSIPCRIGFLYCKLPNLTVFSASRFCPLLSHLCFLCYSCFGYISAFLVLFFSYAYQNVPVQTGNNALSWL